MSPEIHDAAVVSVVGHRRIIKAIELLLDGVDSPPVCDGLDPFVFMTVSANPPLGIYISSSQRGGRLDPHLDAVFIKCLSTE